jgi:Holliday junction resolvasome RuvABC endonuclease subunit
MRIIGIDGATKITGIAVFDDGEYVTHKLFSFSGDASVRIPKMMMAICNFIKEYKPDKIIMEKSMLTNNIDTVQKLSNLAGAVMFYCYSKGIPFEHQYPSQWRQKIGLTQGARVKKEVLKAEAIAAVKQEYGMNLTDDEAEAILIARSGFDLPKITLEDDEI